MDCYDEIPVLLNIFTLIYGLNMLYIHMCITYEGKSPIFTTYATLPTC